MRKLLLIVNFGLLIGVSCAMIFPVSAYAASSLRPKIQGTNDSGFGGIITGVTPCICNMLGMLVSVGGPFGGSYIFSFKNPPRLAVGSFFSKGGFIIGSASGSGKCGTKRVSGCTGEKEGEIIKTIGGEG